MVLELLAAFGGYKLLSGAIKLGKGRQGRGLVTSQSAGSSGPAQAYPDVGTPADFREFEISDYEIVMRGRTHTFRR